MSGKAVLHKKNFIPCQIVFGQVKRFEHKQLTLSGDKYLYKLGINLLLCEYASN